MIEKIRDLSQKTIQNVYLDHQGILLSPYKENLHTDEDYMIMSCTQLELITKYINSDKRIYILLGKNIQASQYNHINNPNIWMIRTDLELPNLILNEGMLIHIPFGLIQENASIYTEIKKYFKYLIMLYVQKEKGFDYDFFEEQNSSCLFHSNKTSLIHHKDYVISDTFEHDNILRKSFKNTMEKPYNLIEVSYINPLDIVENNHLNPVIIGSNSYMELKIDFKFNIKDYTHKTVYPSITHEQAKGNHYYKDKMPIIINDVENIESIFKVDLIQKSDSIYQEKLMKNFMDNNQPKSLCLKQKFSFRFEDYLLSDFSQVKSLSEERIEQLVKDIEVSESVRFYQSKEGIIAAVKEFNEELLKIKEIKYFIQKKEPTVPSKTYRLHI